MKDDLSRIEAQLTDDSYTGPYLSRIEMILKDMEPGGGGGIGFKGPYNSVSALPNPGEENYIYLVVSSDASTDYYDEYYWDTTHQTYTPMGTTKIQLEDYVKKSSIVDSLLDGNMNPVTSNAVYDETNEIKLAISNLSASVISDVNEIKLDISNLSASVSSKASQSEVNEIKIDISDLSASVLHTSGNETATGVKTFSSGINSSKGIIGPKASGESDLHVPLELRGSDTEAWLLFSSRLGSGLGYFGTKSDNKPYFYNTEPHELAFKSDVDKKADNVNVLHTSNELEYVWGDKIFENILMYAQDGLKVKDGGTGITERNIPYLADYRINGSDDVVIKRRTGFLKSGGTLYLTNSIIPPNEYALIRITKFGTQGYGVFVFEDSGSDPSVTNIHGNSASDLGVTFTCSYRHIRIDVNSQVPVLVEVVTYVDQS